MQLLSLADVNSRHAEARKECLVLMLMLLPIAVLLCAVLIIGLLKLTRDLFSDDTHEITPEDLGESRLEGGPTRLSLRYRQIAYPKRVANRSQNPVIRDEQAAASW
jgi:cell division protein FtsL